VSSIRIVGSGPEMNVRPSGAASIQGYSGSACATCRERRIPSVLRTSGTLSEISISPVPSGVTVGYQRPAAMSGPTLHVFVT
jgi:hypothetical protein